MTRLRSLIKEVLSQESPYYIIQSLKTGSPKYIFSVEGEKPSWVSDNRIEQAHRFATLEDAKNYLSKFDTKRTEFWHIYKRPSGDIGLGPDLKESKKDCNCGCNDCGGKAPILTEGKVKHLISEGLQYHIDKKIQLHESVYRIGSEKHFELIREARALWVRGIIDVSEDDQAILETNLGHFGMYKGEKVPLDMPMVNESTFQGNEIAIYDGEDGETYIEKRGTGYYGYNNSFDFTAKDKAELEQKLNMWGYYPIAGSINEETKEVDRYSGFLRNPEDPDSEKFEPTGSVAQFKEELRALFGKFKGDLKNPEFIKGVAEIMVNWKSLLRSQLDEAKKKKKKKKKKDPPLNKPRRGGSKAYYVYVRDPKTKKIVKVSFGSGGLRAKIKDKEKRNAFAARHNCKNKKDRTSPGYWSCNLPRYAEQLGLGSNMNTFW